MNYRVFLIISFIFLLTGCEQNNFDKNVINQEKLTKYKNSGFALVYDNVLNKQKKISNFFLSFKKSSTLYRNRFEFALI